MLAEADHDLTAMAYQGVPDRTFAEFYLHPQRDEGASRKAGRPVFRDVPYVRVMVPGDRSNVVERPVRAQDRQRWPRQWAAFEARREQPVEGTPLTEWPGITRSQVEELAHFKILTVEELANVPDAHAQKFMGIQALKQRARDFMEAAKHQAPLDQMRAENDHLRDELAAMKAQMADLAERLAEAETDGKPSRRKAG